MFQKKPEYLLAILKELKKVHDETLVILKSDEVSDESFVALVHKVKGGAQILEFKDFIRSISALENEGTLPYKVSAFILLLETENQLIEQKCC